MSTPPADPASTTTALDRVLAIGALVLAAASILCFFAIIIGTVAGLNQADYGEGVWPVVAAIPLWGLPLAFVMIITLLIMSFIRKGRANKRP